MRRLLIALGLVASPALAALDTVTIQGRVVTPDGNNATGGSIECTLSAAGTADDTVSGQSQRVALRTISSIGSDGAVSMTLVPNDDITPASTYYSCRFLIPATGSLRRYDWSEMWSLASSPDPIDIGDITRLDTPVGIAAVAAGGSTTQVQFNNAGALAGDSDWTYNSTTNTQTLGKGIVSAKVNYQEFDTTGDGTVDLRLCGDYDGDSTLEFTDVQDCCDGLWDRNGDGTQDANSPVLTDSDSDGTIDDTVAGVQTCRVLPGTYIGSTGGTVSGNDHGIDFRVSNAVLEGSGDKATIFQSRVAPAYFMTRQNGGVTRFANTLVLGGSNITVKNLKVEGISGAIRRNECTTRSCTDGFDADNDGTAEGGQHSLVLYNCSNCTLDNVWVFNADRIAIFPNTSGPGDYHHTIRNSKVSGNMGEHCIAADSGGAYIINNELSGCDWVKGSLGGRCWEQYGGGTLTAASHSDLVFENNKCSTADQGVIFTWAPGVTGTVKGVVIKGNTFTTTKGGAIVFAQQTGQPKYENIEIIGNTIRTTGARNSVHAIKLDGAAAGDYERVTINSNHIEWQGTNGASAHTAIDAEYLLTGAISKNVINVIGTNPGAGADTGINLTLAKGVAIADNAIDLDGTASVYGIRIAGTGGTAANSITVSGNVVDCSDIGSGTRVGVVLDGATQSLFANNHVRGCGQGLWGTYAALVGNTKNLIAGNSSESAGQSIWLQTTGTQSSLNRISNNHAMTCGAANAFVDGNDAGVNLWTMNSSSGCYHDANSMASHTANINTSGALMVIADEAAGPSGTGNSVFDSSAGGYTRYLLGSDGLLSFQGTTNDLIRTDLTAADPTATSKTVTLPDATGTVVLSTLATNAQDVASSAWFGTSTLVFEGTTADGSETTVSAADPTADVTYTIAALTSTQTVSPTVLGTNTAAANLPFVRCGNVSVDPPNIATTATSGTATSAVTSLEANAACACSPRADWNDDLIMKHCYATAGNLNVILYNNSGGALDAAAQTVDYCCTEQ